MTATTVTLNQALDAITVTQMSLHTANPTATGLVGEVTGGSPAYARQTVTFGAASGGVRTISNQPNFNVPAGTTVTHYAIWDGTTCKEYGQFATAESFGNQGTYKVTTGTITLTSP